MIKLNIQLTACALAAAALLTACGGGGTTPQVVAVNSGDTGTCTAAPCINFSEGTVTLVGFGGLDAAVANDPKLSTNKVLMLTKEKTDQPWAGATIHFGSADSSVSSIDFSKPITLRVLSPVAGRTIMVKIENAANKDIFKEVQVKSTKAGEWETLTFSFADAAANTYNKISVFPAAFDNDNMAASEVYYIDELKYTAKTDVPASCSSNLTCFEETTPLAITEFGGAAAALDTGPSGGTGTALKVTRNGGDDYAGAWVALTAGIPSNKGNQVLTARVYSPVAGGKMTIKAEYGENVGTGDINANQAVVQGWQTLTWNLNNLDSTKTYNRFVVLPNLGVVGTGQTYYFDNVAIADAPVVPVSGPTTAAPTPTAAAANVKSIFSGSYTNVNVTGWNVDWSSGATAITDATAGGDAVKLIDLTAGKEYGAIQFAGDKFDATSYTHLNISYWLSGALLPGQVISIKLSNHDGASETNAIEHVVTSPTTGAWQTLSILLSSFTQAANSLSRNNIAEMVISAPRADNSQPVKLYFDNLYFSTNP